MDSIGFYIMIALLGAGAAYGLRHRGKPKPTLSSGKKKLVMILFGIVLVCLLMLVAVMVIAKNNPPH